MRGDRECCAELAVLGSACLAQGSIAGSLQCLEDWSAMLGPRERAAQSEKCLASSNVVSEQCVLVEGALTICSALTVVVHPLILHVALTYSPMRAHGLLPETPTHHINPLLPLSSEGSSICMSAAELPCLP